LLILTNLLNANNPIEGGVSVILAAAEAVLSRAATRPGLFGGHLMVINRARKVQVIILSFFFRRRAWLLLPFPSLAVSLVSWRTQFVPTSVSAKFPLTVRDGALLAASETI